MVMHLATNHNWNDSILAFYAPIVLTMSVYVMLIHVHNIAAYV